MVINDPTGVMERKCQLFHDSNGHVRPAMVTAAMLQYCRVLESMSIVQYSTVQYSTLTDLGMSPHKAQYSTVQYSIVQYSTVHILLYISVQ